MVDESFTRITWGIEMTCMILESSLPEGARDV